MGNVNDYLDSLDKKILGLLFKVSGNVIIVKVFGNEEVFNYFCIINLKNIYRFIEMLVLGERFIS